ncbi:MAG TPA: nucleotidyl transferase AbiEii/AbiGii toxin family protein [Planctomycetota bacterium]|nr:nucleotidyl transferase AbiEii/AbiGii toxin family protein [Planctomycetota bacterium]
MSGKKPPVNLAHSVRDRLLAISRNTGEEANLIWTRYAVERLLYRLSLTPHRRQFVLKGALLFLVWSRQRYRPTRDLDLLGFGAGSAARLRKVFGDICRVESEPDGLAFDPASVTISDIREDREYMGKRVRLTALLGKATIPLQVDVGFGDAVTPPPEEISYPALLDFPAPRLLAYRRETTVAEKLHAMAERGMATSRMKDFHDIFVLSRDFPFGARELAAAIKATFAARGAALPAEVPAVLTDRCAEDAAKNLQWKAFLRKGHIGEKVPALPSLLKGLREFLGPVLLGALGIEPMPGTWRPGGPWRR